MIQIRKRIGFSVTEAGIVREKCKIFDQDGN